MKLESGREIPDELLDEVIDTVVIQHAGYGFDETFLSSLDLVAQSLQEDPDWLPDNQNLTYKEATEVVNKVRIPAFEFANELAQAYYNLKDKYVGTQSWELYR